MHHYRIITSILAIYDTNAQPFVYTGSEHIDITNNNISLRFPINMNNEIVLNPRAYMCDFTVLASPEFNTPSFRGNHSSKTTYYLSDTCFL